MSKKCSVHKKFSLPDIACPKLIDGSFLVFEFASFVDFFAAFLDFGFACFVDCNFVAFADCSLSVAWCFLAVWWRLSENCDVKSLLQPSNL